MAEIRITLHLVAHDVSHRPVYHPLQVRLHEGLQARYFGFDLGGLHYKQPRQVIGFHRDLVGDRFTCHHQASRNAITSCKIKARRPPFASVKVRKYRAAKVQVSLWRRWAFKPDAQRHTFVQRQFGNTAYRHALTQAAAPGHGIAWYPP